MKTAFLGGFFVNNSFDFQKIFVLLFMYTIFIVETLLIFRFFLINTNQKDKI